MIQVAAGTVLAPGDPLPSSRAAKALAIEPWQVEDADAAEDGKGKKYEG